MLTEEKYQEIAGDTDHPLHFLWYAVTANIEGNPLKMNEGSFNERRTDFLYVLRRMLTEGKIKLHRGGEIWESAVDDQIKAFLETWPSSELNSGYSDFYVWFIDQASRPAGVAWRRPDGRYAIAD